VGKLKGASELERANPLQAFCFMAEEFDESAYIAKTLTQTQAMLNRLQESPLELWEKLPVVLGFHDEPVHSLNVVIGFLLMKLAANNGLRVVLSGQGADETIGGYFSYFSSYWQMLIRQGRFRDAWTEIQSHTVAHG